MPTKIYETRVRCPLQTAFDYVADVRTHPEWSTGPMTVQPMTEGSPRVGSTYHNVGRSEVWNTDVASDVEVTEYASPDRFAIVCRDGTGEFRHLFTFHEDGDELLIQRHYTIPDLASLPDHVRQRVEELMPTVIEPSRQGAMDNLKERLEERVASQCEADRRQPARRPLTPDVCG